MHRNTLLFVSILAVIAALLFGFNVGKKLNSPAPIPAPTQTPAVSKTKFLDYKNVACGISFTYPDSLTKLEATSGAVFIDPTNASNSAILSCQEHIIRPTADFETMSLQATNGATISAHLYHDSLNSLIFTHPTTGLDVFLAGLGSAFTHILSTLKVL